MASERLVLHNVGDILVVSFAESKVFSFLDTGLLEADLVNVAEQNGSAKLVLDLEGVEYLASPILGVFVRLEKTLRRRGGGLRICNMAESVYEKILRISALDRFLDIRGSVDEAVASF